MFGPLSRSLLFTRLLFVLRVVHSNQPAQARESTANCSEQVSSRCSFKGFAELLIGIGVDAVGHIDLRDGTQKEKPDSLTQSHKYIHSIV